MGLSIWMELRRRDWSYQVSIHSKTASAGLAAAVPVVLVKELDAGGQGLPTPAGDPQHRVEDERVITNPCRIRGVGVERSPERPFVDAEMVLQMERAMGIEPAFSAWEVIRRRFRQLGRSSELGFYLDSRVRRLMASSSRF